MAVTVSLETLTCCPQLSAQRGIETIAVTVNMETWISCTYLYRKEHRDNSCHCECGDLDQLSIPVLEGA